MDAAKLIVDESKPVLEGGLGPGGSSAFMQQKLQAAAKNLKIKLTTPFEQLSKRNQQIVLNGGDGFEGVAGILQDTFERATDGYREWLTEYMSPVKCTECQGKRLRPSSLSVRVKGLSISEVVEMPIARALVTVRNWELPEREKLIAGRVVEEIQRRLQFLSDVGLDYLSLQRSAGTLSGGESQRIRLATQIGSKLRGVLYVLDEPSIGLHPRDNDRLLATLTHLRDMGKHGAGGGAR